MSSTGRGRGRGRGRGLSLGSVMSNLSPPSSTGMGHGHGSSSASSSPWGPKRFDEMEDTYGDISSGDDEGELPCSSRVVRKPLNCRPTTTTTIAQVTASNNIHQRHVRLADLLQSLCPNPCHPSAQTDCIVLSQNPRLNKKYPFEYRDFSYFLSNEKSKATVKPKSDPPYSEFLPVEPVPSWVNECRHESLLNDFLDYCMKRLEKRSPPWVPHTIKELPPAPDPSSLRNGRCHVIRAWSPSDFHVIFLDDLSGFEVGTDNDNWVHFFQTKEKNKAKLRNILVPKYEMFCFKNPHQLFVGMTQVLGKYLSRLYHSYESGPNPVTTSVDYVVGDLVIIVVPRISIEKGKSVSRNLAYRGVITDTVDAIKKEKCDTCFQVYLLDTGETRITSSKWLRPLPKAFTGFRPMAVRCCLFGISPIGPDWNFSARKKFCHLIQADADFYAEIFPRKMDDSSAPQFKSKTQQLIHNLLSSKPFPLEIYGSPSIPPQSNENHHHHHQKKPHSRILRVSAALIAENLALEWSHIPQRCNIREPIASSPKSSQKKSNRLPSSVTLHFVDANPVPITVLPEEQLSLEFRQLFHSNPDLHKGMNVLFEGGVANILAQRVHDPDGSKFKPSVPLIFKSEH